MATIKLSDGKVVLKDGKVSCECCECRPDEDDLEATYIVTTPFGTKTVTRTGDFSWDWIGPVSGLCSISITWVVASCRFESTFCLEADGACDDCWPGIHEDPQTTPVGNYTGTFAVSVA